MLDWVVLILCVVQVLETVAVMHIYFMVMDINLYLMKRDRIRGLHET